MVKIESLSDHVKVETVDGSVYQGDIVVGADGVHSRVLDEMQRLSEIDIPNSRLFTRGGIFSSSQFQQTDLTDCHIFQSSTATIVASSALALHLRVWPWITASRSTKRAEVT